MQSTLAEISEEAIIREEKQPFITCAAALLQAVYCRHYQISEEAIIREQNVFAALLQAVCCRHYQISEEAIIREQNLCYGSVSSGVQTTLTEISEEVIIRKQNNHI